MVWDIRSIHSNKKTNEFDNKEFTLLGNRFFMNTYNPIDMEVIEAAGGIVWLKANEGCKVAIIHRPKYNDWTLPKGKREFGERWQETALREVYEETGCTTRLDSFAGGLIYQVYDVPKVVLFWNMTTLKNDHIIPNKEIDQCVWMNPKDAIRLMTYDSEKKLLEEWL